MRVSTQDRFWAKVDQTGGPDSCWMWLASKHRFGYGWFRLGGKTVTAHRLALTLASGDGGDLQALHRCNNPSCCNPKHLYWGTPMDNHLDTKRSGHYSPPPRNSCNPPVHHGEKHPRAVMTEAGVRKLRALSKEGWKYHELAAHFGISKAAAAFIVTRRTWKEVPE